MLARLEEDQSMSDGNSLQLPNSQCNTLINPCVIILKFHLQKITENDRMTQKQKSLFNFLLLNMSTVLN